MSILHPLSKQQLAILLAGLLGVPAAPVAGQIFVADAVLRPPDGPEVAIFRTVPSEAVSLRLSVPLDEAPDEAGAGQFIQRQAQERMAALAQRIGARAEVHRTPQGLVYQVSGALTDLDFLGWILRAGIERPSAAEFEDARRVIQVQNDRRMETPQGFLAARLREALVPGQPSVFGTFSSLNRMDAVRLDAIWESSHQRDRALLVVAGRVPSQLALALASDLGIPEGGAGSIPPARADLGTQLVDPEVNRYWVAEGYRLQASEEVAALVVGRWLAEEARAAGEDFEVGIEIWDIGGGRALVVTGAAFPRSVQAMRGWLDRVFEEAASRITDGDVSGAADRLRTEILMAARTPWGLAELVGQALDAGRGPEGVEALLSDLAGLTGADVAALLSTLSTSTPARSELGP